MRNFDEPHKLLIVCTGNTCRSPMAEAFAKRRWPTWEIRSAGLHVTQNRAATEAIQAMQELHLDITRHRPTPVTAFDLSNFDGIVALDKAVSRALVQKFGLPKAKIIDLPVPDPFGDEKQQYLACARFIRNKLHNMAAKIESVVCS